MSAARKIPALWLGRRRAGLRRPRCATSSTASSRRSSARPASGRSRNRPCATACMSAPSRKSSSGPCSTTPSSEFGLTVSDDEVRAAIARNPAFQGTGGSFDPLLYRNRLQQARISEAQFVADMRREIAASQLFGVVRADGLAPMSHARRHLQAGEREAHRRDDLRSRRDRRRRAQADGRAAQRLFRGQQGQVPDPRVPRLLLRPDDGRRRA